MATVAEAGAWLRCPHHHDTAEGLTHHLAPWVEAGVPARVAFDWWARGYFETEGIQAALRGWTPRTYRALTLMESTDSAYRDANPDLTYREVIDAWVCSDIDPARVLCYRERGLSPDAARAIEDERLSGDASKDAVEALLALRPSTVERRFRPWLDENAVAGS